MDAIAARLVTVSDSDDPRVAEFRDIRERDLVGRQGRFVAEGNVVLRMLAQSDRFDAEKILVLDGRVAGIADILAAFEPHIPIMVCSRDIMDRITGFPMHRGVLAIGRTRSPDDLQDRIDRLDDAGLVLVCAGLSNHDNLGGLFRNAAAFSTDFICLDRRCCDPLYRKCIRVSVGTALTLPYIRGNSVEDIGATLAANGFDIVALSPAGRVVLSDYIPGRRTALIVGTEGEGLAPSLLARLDSVRIAQSRSLDSLNVAMAAGIALHSIATSMGRV
ncbi:MAG: RNA methyltransferase [Alphaproteobacteria bacterium]|nr:RNA methyltransferase [Alphaproteobacteria bacterium]